ncbi:hypothetical protein ACP4OV_011917 [Aristida adscensionis]
MASGDGAGAGDDDTLLLVHQLPLDLEVDGLPARRLAHLLPPLHPSPPAPPPPSPFRPPPPPAAAASAEPRLSFRGWLGAPRHWDLWVAKLRPLHAALWRRLGIHDAVLASTCRFKRDAAAVLHLAAFWCPATNTFAFPWGEATLTLHDVALLAGFPALGGPAPAPAPPEWRPDEAALNGVRLGFNRSACKKAHHSAWIKHFLTDRSDAVAEHAAFLALWLTRFVLPGHPESTMRQSVFPIAVRLARGDPVALAPAVLASLYRDLRDIKAFLVAAGAAATTGSADMLSSLSLYAPLYIVQHWMWERFPALRPGKENPVRDGEPMASRWHDLSRKINPALIRETLSSGDSFVWQPYVIDHRGWVRGSDLAGNDELRSLAHCLRPCELVGMDCIEQYLPHRVAMQFGLDQDVPGDVHRANQDWVTAWQTYELEGKNVAFFIPQSEPGVTARYANWWRQQLPPADLHAEAASIPAEWKTSKRKVKKTPAAMEAEAEKERRMKKARPSPSDKKRKLEELYDAKLSDWLAAARDGISDAADGSWKRGSLPKYDMGSDDTLLPNVGASNDDVVLLVPRKQTTTTAVIQNQANNINPAIPDRGNFIVDKLPSMPNEPEGGVTAKLEDKSPPSIPVDRSFDITGQLGEGATEVMESEKEVSGVSKRPEEATAPVREETEEKVSTQEAICVTEVSGVSDKPDETTTPIIEEKEDNVGIEGVLCVTGMNPEEKNIRIVKEVDEGNAASVEVGRVAEEAVEAAPQRPNEVNAGVMKNSDDAVVSTEEALPVHHANRAAGCGDVSCILEDSNVAGVLGTNDGQSTCHSFVAEDQQDVPCVEEILGGENSQMVQKDSNKVPQEAPQIGVVKCVEAIVPIGTDIDGEQGKVPPTMDGLLTSNNMAAAPQGVPQGENDEIIKDHSPGKKDAEPISAAPQGVPQGENAEIIKDHSPGKKDAEPISMEVAGEAAKHEQIIASPKQGADEEHKEFAEVDNINITDPKMHSQFITEKPETSIELECSETDGAKILTGKHTDGKNGEVPEVGDTEVEKVKELIVNIGDENPADVSEVVNATVDHIKVLAREDMDKKFEEVSELENAGGEATHRPIEECADGRINELLVVGAEMEQPNGHERDSDRPDDIFQVDLLTRNEARWLEKEGVEDNATKVPQIKHEIVTDETQKEKGTNEKQAPIEEDTNGKPCADGKNLPEKEVDGSKKVYIVEQAEEMQCKVLMEKGEENIEVALGVEQAAEGQDKALTGKDIHDHVEEITPVEQVDGQSESLKRIGTQEILEQITHPQKEEFVKDMIEASKDSTNDEMPCNSTKVPLKGDQMEVSGKGTLEEQQIRDEIISQREPSSVAAVTKVEGVYDHNILDMHEEVALTHKQDHKTTCENREATMLEESHMLDREVKSDWVALEADETHAAGGIQNQEILYLDMQLAMEGKKDLGATIENKRFHISKDADILVCTEYQTDPTGTVVMEVKPTEVIQNQEPLDNNDQVMEKRMECEIIDGSERSLEEANKLGGGGADTSMVAVEVGGSRQRKEACSIEELQVWEDNKQHHGVEHANEKRILEGTIIIADQVVEKPMQCKISDGSEISLEEASKPSDLGLGTSAVAVDISESTQNKEACSTKEENEDKQHQGVEHANRILEDKCMVNSELKSDSLVVEVNMAGLTEETLNQCALSVEKVPAVQEKQDQGMTDENRKRDLVDTDTLECAGVEPGGTMKLSQATQAGKIAGPDLSSKNKQKEASFEEHNILEVEGSETNQSARKETDGSLPSEPEYKVEVKKENLDNRTEISICRENDEVSEKDQTSAEVDIAPSNVDDQGESDNGWVEESTKRYDKLASDQTNIACHQPIKFGKPSIEEVRKIHNTRSTFLKDIKDSLRRIRAEPSNRAHATGVRHYSRHAVQDPISVCKDIRVPLPDSAREFGRDRVSDLVVTSTLEESPRWRQEQYALQILEDVQNARLAEKTRMEMEIRILKAQIASEERQVMNLDNLSDVVKSRSKRH